MSAAFTGRFGGLSTTLRRVAAQNFFLLAIGITCASARADFYEGLRAYDAKDYPAAVRHWKTAADGGDAASQARLAALYENGYGTPQNYVQAHLYYNLAAAQGDDTARAARDALGERMTKDELAEARHLAAGWQPQVAATTSADEPQKPRPQWNAAVEWTQKNLASIGYDPGPADGMLGAKTTKAIMAFQRDYGLVADGKVSGELITKIENVMADGAESDDCESIDDIDLYLDCMLFGPDDEPAGVNGTAQSATATT